MPSGGVAYCLQPNKPIQRVTVSSHTANNSTAASSPSPPLPPDLHPEDRLVHIMPGCPRQPVVDSFNWHWTAQITLNPLQEASVCLSHRYCSRTSQRVTLSPYQPGPQRCKNTHWLGGGVGGVRGCCLAVLVGVDWWWRVLCCVVLFCCQG